MPDCVVVVDRCRAGVFTRCYLVDNCHFSVRVLSVALCVALPEQLDGGLGFGDD